MNMVRAARIDLLEKTIRRLNTALAFTTTIEAAAEIHLTIDELTKLLEEIKKLG